MRKYIDTKHFENVCCFPIVYIQLLKYLDNNFMSAMPHDHN